MASHDELLRDLAWKASFGTKNLEGMAADYIGDPQLVPSLPHAALLLLGQAFVDGLRFKAIVDAQRRQRKTK